MLGRSAGRADPSRAAIAGRDCCFLSDGCAGWGAGRTLIFGFSGIAAGAGAFGAMDGTLAGAIAVFATTTGFWGAGFSGTGFSAAGFSITGASIGAGAGVEAAMAGF
jgi:hypothetical protein